MEPAVVNESIHTGCKQHHRICVRICVLASSVNWASDFCPTVQCTTRARSHAAIRARWYFKGGRGSGVVHDDDSVAQMGAQLVARGLKTVGQHRMPEQTSLFVFNVPHTKLCEILSSVVKTFVLRFV